MKVLHCLRCHRQHLFPTGAFWACSTCGYSITQAALLAEATGEPVDEKHTPARRQKGHT
jgi:ribosomal protein L37AE/L43A